MQKVKGALFRQRREVKKSLWGNDIEKHRGLIQHSSLLLALLPGGYDAGSDGHVDV